MTVIQNKWVEKERKKKAVEKDNRSEEPVPPHMNVSRASRSRTLRGVRK